MNYHNITTDDMLNGEGLRVVLWLSGCNHKCKGCHNPQTWDKDSGIPFDEKAKEELFAELGKEHISGVTFSGGDPMHENNAEQLLSLITQIREKFPTKTIWVYSGFTINQVVNPIVTADVNMTRDKLISVRKCIVMNADVFVDGKFVQELADPMYEWAGSTNQRILRKGDDY